MVITFYKHVNGDWIEMYIDGDKVFGGHSMLAPDVAKYISKALKNNPTGVNTLHVIEKYFDDDMIGTPVITGHGYHYLGENEQKDH